MHNMDVTCKGLKAVGVSPADDGHIRQSSLKSIDFHNDFERLLAFILTGQL